MLSVNFSLVSDLSRREPEARRSSFTLILEQNQPHTDLRHTLKYRFLKFWLKTVKFSYVFGRSKRRDVFAPSVEPPGCQKSDPGGPKSVPGGPKSVPGDQNRSLGGSWGSLGDPWGVPGGSLGGPGRLLEGFQRTSGTLEGPQSAPRGPQKSILGSFWSNLGVIWGSFLGQNMIQNACDFWTSLFMFFESKKH